MSAEPALSSYTGKPLHRRIAGDECALRDGAIATELQRLGAQWRHRDFRLSDDAHWGFDALHNAPHAALEVHQAYLAADAVPMAPRQWVSHSCILPSAPIMARFIIERVFASMQSSPQPEAPAPFGHHFLERPRKVTGRGRVFFDMVIAERGVAPRQAEFETGFVHAVLRWEKAGYGIEAARIGSGALQPVVRVIQRRLHHHSRPRRAGQRRI